MTITILTVHTYLLKLIETCLSNIYIIFILSKIKYILHPIMTKDDEEYEVEKVLDLRV